MSGTINHCRDSRQFLDLCSQHICTVTMGTYDMSCLCRQKQITNFLLYSTAKCSKQYIYVEVQTN